MERIRMLVTGAEAQLELLQKQVAYLKGLVSAVEEAGLCPRCGGSQNDPEAPIAVSCPVCGSEEFEETLP